MNKKEHNEIEKSAIILGLGEEATMQEIKERYRKLALKYHPDRCPETRKSACAERFKKMKQAYEEVMDYCTGYSFSFREKDIKKSPEDEYYEEHRQRFYNNWWGESEEKE